MAKAKKNVDRRKFLRGAAGLVASSPVAFAQRAAEKPETTGGAVDVTSNVRCGADFMVDVFKSLGLEYCAANPGTSFRGLHESVINYGKIRTRNSSPACTKNRRSRWPTATPRSKASP